MHTLPVLYAINTCSGPPGFNGFVEICHVKSAAHETPPSVAPGFDKDTPKQTSKARLPRDTRVRHPKQCEGRAATALSLEPSRRCGMCAARAASSYKSVVQLFYPRVHGFYCFPTNVIRTRVLRIPRRASCICQSARSMFGTKRPPAFTFACKGHSQPVDAVFHITYNRISARYGRAFSIFEYLSSWLWRAGTLFFTAPRNNRTSALENPISMPTTTRTSAPIHVHCTVSPGQTLVQHIL